MKRRLVLTHTLTVLAMAVSIARADETLFPIVPVLPVVPVHPAQTDSEHADSVQWGPLLRQSMFFLGVEHGFRLALDKDTQAGLGGNFFTGYWKSVSNLHGWADGDPFIVNYVGHPLQGAIAADIWIHNDPKYRSAEIGTNRRYWVGRMRAMAYSWAYSEQFEIGPLSEASIGHIQSKYPQQGFVDHVITPVVGMGWMIAEDAIDRFVIEKIEGHTSHRWVSILARGFLNPARTFANSMEWEHPWRRENQFLRAEHAVYAQTHREPKKDKTQTPTTPRFELAAQGTGMPVGGGVRCAGGGASGIVNLNGFAGIETDISGCKMLGLGPNLSGDQLTFTVGPRFTYRGSGRWMPWAHVLVGVEKDSEELLYPDKKAELEADPPRGVTPHQMHALYTRDWGATGFAMQLGGGVDWALNRNFAFRLGDVDYVHEFARADQVLRPPELRVTMGVVLRVGD